MKHSELSPATSTTLSRRALLQILLSAPALSLAPLSLTTHDTQAMGLEHLSPATSLALVQVARLLFPHEGLADEIYLGVVKDIEADISTNEGLLHSVAETPILLNKAVARNWMQMSHDAQIEALAAIEDASVFGYLRNRTIESLYRNPAVWKLVGYEGSSIEYGGYLHRGFDDIDWLEDK
ncbi:hypothetical protein [Parahaliea mediterranea]|uniref:hypothetical protein n=1 Tax=Parahaliea mediterranea TaxID=651086 RepID=UPI000E2EF045|nr:hypothetical protein [Parahaliea mediterranea]